MTLSRSRETLALALVAAFVATSARAQVQAGFGDTASQQTAQTVATTAGPAMSALAGTNQTSATTTLPIAGSNTANLQSYSGNSSGLSSAGSAAFGTSDTANLMLSGQQNAQSYGLSGSESWLSQAYSVAQNPGSQVSSSGSGQATCSTTTSTQTTTSNNGTYTCETTQSVTDQQSACVQNLSVSTTTTWYYTCQNTYDQTTRSWVISPSCSALSSSSACTSTGTNCTSPAPPYFQAQSCLKGTQWNSSSQSCTETRQVVVGTKYNYNCSDTYDPNARVWNNSAACNALSGSSSCTSNGSTCAQPTQPITFSCQLGTDVVQGTQTCNETWQVNVGDHYIYDGNKIWNGQTWQPDNAENALTGAGTGTCQVQATTCSQGSGLQQSYSCTSGYSVTSNSGTCVPGASGISPDSVYPYWKNFVYSYYYRGEIDVYAAYGPLDPFVAAVQAATNNNCIPDLTNYRYQGGRATGPHAGQVWYEFFGLFCAQPISAVNAPPGNSVNYVNWSTFTGPLGPSILSSSTIYINATPATLGANTNPANLQAMLNEVPLGPSCPNNLGSLQYTWVSKEQVQYTQNINNNYPGCNPPAGMTVASSSCASSFNGQCTATTYNYIDPTGGCETWTDQWQCNAPVNGAGNALSVTPYLISQGWSSDCNSLASNRSCSYSSTNVTQGADTRTINGLSVYAGAWAQTLTYSCPVSNPVDTCSYRDGGCSVTATSCAGTDGNGNCNLWNYNYSCPNNDGSNGCEQTTYQYTCTADIPPADPAVSTSQYIVSDGWSNECNSLAGNSTCSLSNTTNDGTSTRTISGLPVTENGWTQTETFTCWTQNPIDGCTGNVNGCTLQAQTCAGNDNQGNCSVYNYTYSCPADDGSGNCGVKTSTYTCSQDVPPADPATSTTTVVSGTSWQGSCPQASNSMCNNQGTVCTDANSTKTINGIQVTEPCWSETTTYMCESLGPQQNDCQVPAGCVKTGTQCLDTSTTAAGGCKTTQYTYTCSQTSSSTVTSSSCSTQMCVNGMCFNVSGLKDNASMGKAYAALATAQVSGADQASNVKIMPGNAMGCHKDLTGISNCCNDSGWGASLGLQNCSADEKNLIHLQQEKACHYIGTYCSNSSFFGICLAKEMKYCCFAGPLPRIINEAGRTQIGKAWGSAKNPDCSGFTVAQFQSLDLSNVDFSDFYSSTLNNLNQPDSSSVVTQVQTSLANLQSQGLPTAIPATPPSH